MGRARAAARSAGLAASSRRYSCERAGDVGGTPPHRVPNEASPRWGEDRPRFSVAVTATTTDVPRSRSWGEPTTLLTVFVVLRLALPSQLTLASLGGLGSPATLVGLTFVVLWAWQRLNRTTPAPGSPVVPALWVLVAAMLASYGAAAMRPGAAEELQLALMAVLGVLSWVGPALVAADGIESFDRLLTLAHRIVVVGALFAALGLVQFVTGQAWVDTVAIPGLTPNTPLNPVTTREGFNRPAGTAIHAIEFGAIVCMMLPLAVTVALGRKRGPGGRLAAWLPACLLAAAIATSSSRSAFVGFAVGLVALAPVLSRSQRLVGGAAVAIGAVVVFLTVPGMVGSVAGLFGGASNDPGVTSRIEGYGVAATFIGRSPWLGRGLGTFLPSYWIFDNQYLLLLVETGLVGVVALLILVAATLWCCLRTISSWPQGSAQSLLGGGLLASCMAGTVGLALFDGFAFPMMPALLFLVMGMSGAAYRLSRATSS